MEAPRGPLLFRLIFAIIGTAALALGIIGIFLPLLPTVPFILLAAACFARASPRVEAWLVSHPRFGPYILDWRERGAIAPKAKAAACIGMSIGYGLFLTFSHPSLWLAIGVAAVMVLIAIYVLSRPS